MSWDRVGFEVPSSKLLYIEKSYELVQDRTSSRALATQQTDESDPFLSAQQPES